MALTAIVALAGSLTVALATEAAAAPSCPDVVVIGARGSGEAPQPPSAITTNSEFHGIGASLDATYEAFKDAAITKGLTIEVSPVVYPAEPVIQVFNPVLIHRFSDSIQFGINDTIDQIHKIVTRGCLVTPQIVLMGYSQGAMAITGALSALPPAEKTAIAGVYFIGDPMFDPSKPFSKGGVGLLGGGGMFAALKQAAGLVAWIAASGNGGSRIKLADLSPVLKVSKPLPAEFSNRAFDYCYPRDPVCQAIGGITNIGKFFSGGLLSTPHDRYKDGPNSDAVTWLTNQVKKLVAETKMTISPQTGPTGTVLTLSGVCPAGSTNVGVEETLAVHDLIANAKVNPNGTWTLQQGTFISNQPDVTDPATKQKVWAPINWNLHVTCSGNGVAFAYPDTKWSSKAGKAIKTNIVPTATGFNVTVAPGSPCPFPSSVAVVSVSTIPADYSQLGDGTTGSAYVDNKGNWPSITVATKKYPSGTLINIGAACYRTTILDQEDFLYYYQHIAEPAA